MRLTWKNFKGGEMLTNKTLSDALDIPLFQIRRWTKELLPPDPKATRRSGYAREFSNNDGFLVYFGGYLVSALSLTFFEAKEVIKEITPWLEQNGMQPDIPDSARREGPDQRVKFYTIEILRAKGEWDIHIRGIISEKTGRGFNSPYTKRVVEDIRYSLNPDELIIHIDSEHWKLEGKGIPKEEWFAKTLPISQLLENFISNVLGNYSDWKEKWEALAKNN
jgi:hypothetical protein